MAKQLDSALTGLAMFFVRHWWAVLTGMTLLFTLPIVGIPLLMSSGVPPLQTLAEVAFHFYGGPVCHQMPERSLFVFGHQMTVCSRCFAIYASFLAGCVLFAFVRTKLKVWSIFYYALCVVPMGIDGTAQLLGIAIPRGIGPGLQLIWTVESTNEMRVLTGAIFGLASALYVLPYLQAIFNGDDGPAPGVKVVRQDTNQDPTTK